MQKTINGAMSARTTLSRFLYSDVAEEPNGMTVTVLSLLARLGMDPWMEAEKLSGLPKPAAAKRLSRIILSTCRGCRTLPEAEVIAARLVVDLPSSSAPQTAAQRAPRIRDRALTVLAVAFAVAWLTLFLTGHRNGSADGGQGQGSSVTGESPAARPATH